MSDRPEILIAALSGRALAAAAQRAGIAALVLDLFEDSDTRRLARASLCVEGDLRDGFRDGALLAAADRLAPPDRGAALVYGAGFENRPALLARLARGRRLMGNDPEVVAALKDPHRFFPLLVRLGVPHPEVRRTRPCDPRGWLVKGIGASGGGHIREARWELSAVPGVYYQRKLRGTPVSALFLANGRDAQVLGFSEQWSAARRGGRRFCFGGAACPAEVSSALARDMTEIVVVLTRQYGLIGLNSADFLVAGDRAWLLEVNPRPGATLDIFDRGRTPGLFPLHLRACDGALPTVRSDRPGAAATSVLYARRRLQVPAGFSWPRWTADRPPAGSVIRRGEPLCTILAKARSLDAARKLVTGRAREIEARLILRDDRRQRPMIGAATATAVL